MSINVLLAEDQSKHREWIKNVLEAGGYRIAGEAANGREAVCLAWRLHPELVIMNLRMPVLNGLDAAREILRRLPSTQLLIFTTYAEEAVVAEALRIGIRGFISRNGVAADLLQALKEVLAGKLYVGTLSLYAARSAIVALAS